MFDKLDRMVDRFESDLESHWVFDMAGNGIGQLAEAYTGKPALTLTVALMPSSFEVK